MSEQQEDGVRRPRKPRERLDSLNNPQYRPPPRAQREAPKSCINVECGANSLILEDHKLVCTTCGTVALENENLVTDLQFDESTGRAVLQGHRVAADSAHASGGQSFRRRGVRSDIPNALNSGMLRDPLKIIFS